MFFHAVYFDYAAELLLSCDAVGFDYGAKLSGARNVNHGVVHVDR
jgi:hypothetical protein